jgi:hypothetical protein
MIFVLIISILDKETQKSDSESHTADDWGFVLITFINGFQLRTIKRFCNKANEKRQNNKVINSK